MSFQHIEYGGRVPRGIAELEGVAMGLWQRVQKDLESTGIDVPVRGKLKQDRSEFVTENLNVVEESCQRRLGIPQLLHVRDEPAPFRREQEIRGSRFPPLPKTALNGKAVETVVQLDRVEVALIVVEHLRRGPSRWIVPADPMLVVPAGSADPDISAHIQGLAIGHCNQTAPFIYLDNVKFIFITLRTNR